MYVILVDENGCLSARTMLDNIKSQAELGISGIADAKNQNDIDDVSNRFKEILDMSKIALAKLEEAGLSETDPDYFKVGGTD